jgi:hypothetical protein
MKRHRSILLALALSVTAALAASAGAFAQAPVTQCSASFHVLHNDRIGGMQVPAGVYQLKTNELTCAKASVLFSEFLKDYNGVLPKPWHYTAQGPGQAQFVRGNGSQGFSAQRTGAATAALPGPVANGGGSHGDLECPGVFDVLHNDRVGGLSIPKGDYRVTLLGGNLSCGTADSLLSRFLRDPDGNLGGGWVVLPSTGEFVNGSSHNGFRIKAVNA